MKPTPHRHSPWAWLKTFVLATLLALALTGCATGPKLVFHSFEFHAATDSTDIEVLDFRYGDSKQPGASAPRWLVERGEISTGGGTGGEMRQGFDLYVKWRIKATGEVLEDTADLRPRMPRDITDHRIYFWVKGRQLWVYLVTPEKRAKGSAPSPLQLYPDLKVINLYPLSSK